MLMKTKLIILSVLFAFFATATWAQGQESQTGDSKIIVWLKSGATTEVLFDDLPEFLYQDGNVSLKSDKTDLSWSLSDLEKFTFEAAAPVIPTDVKTIRTTGHKLDLAKGCAVYDMNGKLVRKHVKSLSELPKGTYIVNDGSVTTKVVRR